MNPHDVPSLSDLPRDAPSLDPAAMLDRCWQLLASAANERGSPIRTPTLATVAPDGSPRARLVVLRDVGRDRRELIVHTDSRSPKVLELAREPRVALCFYDPERQEQIRVDALATVHTGDDPVVNAQWNRTHPISRETYRVAKAPSSPIDGPDDVGPLEPTGRPHFAVIRCVATRIEWLWLRSAGHRRIAFDLERGTDQWLVP